MPFAHFPSTLTPAPELELILHCLPDHPDRSAIRRSALANIDWISFLDRCRIHAVRPLINRTLTLVEEETAPSQVRSSLKQFTLKNAHRNTILTIELARIIDALHEKGIGAATFKGPVLAEHAYGSIALREFLDIDIIVRKSDFPETERFLLRDGYQTASQNREYQDYLRESGQASFRRPGERFGVDLHWKLSPFGMPFPFPEDEIWPKLQKLSMSGFEMPTLAWDHLAVFMACHGARERWRKLKWVCDFAALNRSRPELDWDDLRKRAAGSHCSRSLLVASQLSDAVGLTAPPQLLDAAQGDAAVERVTRRVLSRLVDPRPETQLSKFVDTSANTERLRDKVKLSAALLTTLTVSDFRTIRLHRRLRPLYYVIRPFRIAIKVLTTLIQRAAR